MTTSLLESKYLQEMMNHFGLQTRTFVNREEASAYNSWFSFFITEKGFLKDLSHKLVG